ncbi:MAG: sigma-70 family RNA polymerase sigma factor [Deltaproteobacteria bacterium]|nr:sigma-70 family RNA polymerase sigma factor [Deltaproteobacteria bacterium]
MATLAVTTTDDELHAVVRRVYPRVLARVLRTSPDLEAAQDAVHDAIERALSTWPSRGRPESPEGWLVTVARNRRIDGVRHQVRVDRHCSTTAPILRDTAWSPRAVEPELLLAGGWNDDMLRLVFTCCDPVLGLDERTALTLSMVAGLSTAEIARAFLVSRRTMEQRLTRAKRRLRARRDDYAPVGPHVAPQRLDAALAVVHLVFNEGYWSGSDQAPIRRELCTLALGLARSLQSLLPNEAEVDGLLSLLLLHDARMSARFDDEGRPIPLPEQDRSRWDRARVAEGSMLLQATLARGHVGPFQLEAAIAAVHTTARSAAQTDWPQIAELYQLLAEHRPSPVVRVNQAFAVARAQGAAVGLALLDREDHEALAEYPYAHLVRGALLGELGRTAEALASLDRAASLARNSTEAEQIRARARALANLRT